MRRRRALNDYLRAHDPVGGPETVSATHADTESNAAAPASRRRVRRIGLPALAAATTLTAVAVVAFMPGRASHTTDAFLSPEAAVAAASENLEQDGILHWKFEMRTELDGRPTFNGRPVYGMEQWIDLKTYATHQIFPVSPGSGRAPSPTMGRTVGTKESWYNGKRTYRVLWDDRVAAPDGRRIVVRTVRRRGEKIPPSREITPIIKVRQLLRSAARGTTPPPTADERGYPPVRSIKLLPAPDEHGVPVVKVVRTRELPYVTATDTTWITREKTPRWLRSVGEAKPNAKGRKKGATTSISRRDISVWELLPRTPENIAKVQPPAFDPSKYKVTTQFLGPPKR